MKTKSLIFTAILVAAILAVTTNTASAQQSLHQKHMSMGKANTETKPGPYAGQQKRQIKSLSAKDLDDLTNGRSWGLANKAAELNGMPGPKHVLEMQDKISLTAAQTTAIKQLFAAMKAEAVPLGKRLVELERALNAAFAARTIDDQGLSTMLDDISAVRAKLRYVHLATHLKTLAVLSSDQIDDYNRLRGYGG